MKLHLANVLPCRILRLGEGGGVCSSSSRFRGILKPGCRAPDAREEGEQPAKKSSERARADGDVDADGDDGFVNGDDGVDSDRRGCCGR